MLSTVLDWGEQRCSTSRSLLVGIGGGQTCGQIMLISWDDMASIQAGVPRAHRAGSAEVKPGMLEMNKDEVLFGLDGGGDLVIDDIVCSQRGAEHAPA